MLLCCTIANAQSHTYKKPGKVEIVGDVKVEQLVQKHIELNDRVKTVPGFRIQIASLSGNNCKARAFDLKDRFCATYPEVSAYLVFDEPNFKVKVGDFTTKLDAYVFLQKIKATYPGNIIKDEVYPIRLDWSNIVPETEADAEN